MDEIAAQKLVQKTLEAPFDKDRFVYLVKNILNRVEDAPFTYQGKYIFADFADSIKLCERVGKYRDPNDSDKHIDILIVHLQRGISLERARTMQRNYVAKYLNGSRGDVLRDAALVAFVAPNSDDWRFSFVKMEYRFDETGKVREELTPARRCSFLVGTNEHSHTAQSCLLPVLSGDEADPTLKDLEDIFSVERVTKEFFEKYRDLFLDLEEALGTIVERDAEVKADFEAKGVNTVDFAKKLLGQIVFLYFLQKKGWFGVARGGEWGAGSKHFLRELFEKKHGDYDNFFNDILEPLFYEALRLERPDDYYSRFNCRIPFLNGGLFDPLGDYDWVNTDILLPNELFSNAHKTKEGDSGNGVLDIFDRYNFTVKEDEPLEKEVAVDPEMLGKVFENLLEIKDRKSQGTYYTPREIVHYMCRESLTHYLAAELDGRVKKDEIETLLKYGEAVVENDSRVIGEGRETQRYAFRLPQDVREHAALIDEKLDTLRVCDPAVGSGAFVVGMMNEVVRTRNALATYLGDAKERTPYHFKRHAIQNCLYGVDIEPSAVEIAKLRLWLSLIVDEEKREAIQPLPNLDYKIVRGDALLGVEKNLFNNHFVRELERLKPLYFDETSVSKKEGYKKQIDDLIGKITNGRTEFDFEVYFSEVFHEKKGFDVVIGNPPYIQLQKDRGKLGRLYKDAGFTTFTATGDIYQLFYEKGCQLLTPQRGLIAYITSNSWLKAQYGRSTRRYFVEQHTPLQLLEIGKDVFENAIVDTNILIARSGKSDAICKAVDMDRLPDKAFPPEENLWGQLRPREERPWSALSAIEQSIMDKMEAIGTPLKEWNVSINYGIKTGYNDAFIIDDETKEALVAADPNSADIIKPVLRGRDIQRYQAQWAGLWLIDTHNGYDDVSAINIEDYPAIKNHLDKFYPNLEKRYDKGKTPYNLRNCAYHEDFEKEKLVWMDLTEHGRFAYDAEGMFCVNTAFMMSGQAIKYLCAILNSRLITWFMGNTALNSGMGVTRWIRSSVETIPIPKISADRDDLIATIVDYIIYLKKQSSTDSLMVKYFEQIIDGLVYEIYLTDELHRAGKYFFKPLRDEQLPSIEEITGDKMSALRAIFKRLFDRKRPVRKNLFFFDSLEIIRTIEGKEELKVQHRPERDPLLALAGTLTCDVTDIGERHDEYIGQALVKEMRGVDNE